MTVADLIAKLSKYPPSMLIAIRDECESDGEYETIEIEHRPGDDEIVLVIV